MERRPSSPAIRSTLPEFSPKRPKPRRRPRLLLKQLPSKRLRLLLRKAGGQSAKDPKALPPAL
jgi:hypothetical protein